MLPINRHFPCEEYSCFSHINFRGKIPKDPVNADMASITIKQPEYVNFTTCFHITITACGNELSVQNSKTWKGKKNKYSQTIITQMLNTQPLQKSGDQPKSVINGFTLYQNTIYQHS